MIAVLLGAAAGLLASPLVLWSIRWTTRQPPRPSAALTVGVIAATALIGGWALAWADPQQVPASWWLLLVPGVALAVVDLLEHRLPDRLIIVTAGGVLVALTASAFATDEWSRWWQAAAAAAVAFVAFLILAMFSGMGYGDVKLATVIAGCAGYGSMTTAAAALLTGFLLARIVGLVLLLTGRGRHHAMAVGPWLLLGAAASLAWAS